MTADQPVDDAERRAAEALVVAYARGLDARDWAAYRDLFTDEVEIDYSSLGTSRGRLRADDWVDRCRVLENFDATLHRVTNVVVARAATGLRVESYVDAIHFITVGERTLEAVGVGRYAHALSPTPNGLRISACSFDLSGCPGGRPAFDEAFAAARARHAERRRPPG